MSIAAIAPLITFLIVHFPQQSPRITHAVSLYAPLGPSPYTTICANNIFFSSSSHDIGRGMNERGYTYLPMRQKSRTFNFTCGHIPRRAAYKSACVHRIYVLRGHHSSSLLNFANAQAVNWFISICARSSQRDGVDGIYSRFVRCPPRPRPMTTTRTISDSATMLSTARVLSKQNGQETVRGNFHYH